MDGDHETARGVGLGALVLMCLTLAAAVVIVGYVLVAAFFKGAI